MSKIGNKVIEEKLNILIDMMHLFLALEFFKNGLSKQTIAKRLHLAKATVVNILEGVKKEK